jgi:hypothetical protein
VKILMGHLAQVSSSKERNDTTIVKVRWLSQLVTLCVDLAWQTEGSEG